MTATDRLFPVSALAALMLVLHSGPAQAAETRTTMSVTATVVESCRAATGAAGGPSTGSAGDAPTSNVSVECNDDVDWSSSVEVVPSQAGGSTDPAASDVTLAASQRDPKASTPQAAGEGDLVIVTITY